MLVWKEASCLENLQIFYSRATISEMAKKLSVSVVTFRDNKQVLCMFLQLPTTTELYHYLRFVTQ